MKPEDTTPLFSAGRPLLMVGCGNMGSALLDGWLKAGLFAGDLSKSLIIISPTEATRDRLAQRYGAPLYASPANVPEPITPALVVLAVKPTQLNHVLSDLSLRPELLSCGLVSVAAGKELSFYEAALPDGSSIIRAMPNTPSQIGQGITGCIGNNAVTPLIHQAVDRLFAAVGLCVWLDAEEHMHRFTALCGSGPAFILYLIECLLTEAKAAGISESDALPIVTQLICGSAAIALQSEESISTLRDAVTSKGGVTAAGLAVWMEETTGMSSLLRRTMMAAASRSLEMVKEI